MKKSTKLLHVLLSISFMLIVSCQDNQILKEPVEDSDSPLSMQTRAVDPYDFDWENADWMPTPSGQSRIPSPWVGQGSLVSTYGLDVINDRKVSDGWELMYNTFDPNASGQLINPYFVLYNKYRGLLRIFLYTTTQFYSSSSNLQDGISVISSYNTSLLNFVGKEIVDIQSEPSKSYSQIHPEPVDGTPPLASNRWYMMQYELAYDRNLSTIPYNQIQLSWSLASLDVANVNIAGGVNGTLNGTIGAASSTSSNIISELKNTGETVGKGVLAGVGLKYIDNMTIDAETGANTQNLPKSLFKSLSKGVSSALSAATGDIPGAVTNILSGVFGGSSSGPTAASFRLTADMSIKGTLTNSGAFPSTPISFWMPGTDIPSNAVGFIPLYNKPLGVCNFLPGAPKIPTHRRTTGPYYVIDPWNDQELEYYVKYIGFPQPDRIDYSDYLEMNPELQFWSQYEIIEQEMYVKYYRKGNPSQVYSQLGDDPIYWESWTYGAEHSTNPPQEPVITEMGVRFTIKIIPQDDNIPPPIIYKTFLIWKLT